MNKCQHHDHDKLVNGFIDLNGIPYLIGEYISNHRFREVDRSMIRSDIFVNTSEAMRAVVDINIDDIGVRGSDNHPAVLGNNTKRENLLRMIERNKDYLHHQLPVFRPGIVVKVNYQIELYRTQQVLRTLSEDFVIQSPTYFLDINSSNIDDNAIIANFSDSIVSTITEFTHGRERIQVRITNVQLYYQIVKDNPRVPHANRFGNNSIGDPSNPYPGCADPFYYHDRMQNIQCMGDIDPGFFVPTTPDLKQPSWSMFNKFYHFDNEGTDMVLHKQEIFDPMTKTGLIPCGRVKINRCFIVNPSHRLIFNFSIWKNDVTIVRNTRDIADILEVSLNGCHCHHDHINDSFVVDHEDECHCNHHNNDDTDDRQDAAIDKLNKLVYNLYHEVHHKPGGDRPPKPPVHHCDHSNLDSKLDEIEGLLKDIIANGQPSDPEGCGCNHEHTSITVETVRELIDEIKNSQNEGGENNG